jgi:hypothetical protein
MSLDPMNRQSWRGVTDALRPPPGYEFHAAICTSYGLALDAVLAALLALEDVDATDLSVDTLSKVIAATKLAGRVQILVQRGTVSGKTVGLPSRLAGLLDRMIVPITVSNGVFHPKLWVVCFRPRGTRKDAKLDATHLKSRVIVSSRNLSDSACLEMGVMFESTAAREGIDLGRQVASALRSCDQLSAGAASPLVRSVAGLMDKTRFEATAESATSARLHWQDEGSASNASRIPKRNHRLIVVSPFLSDRSVRDALDRSEDTLVISTPGALAKLSLETVETAELRAVVQGHPVLYALRDDRTGSAEEVDASDDDELGRLDGLHAKLILAEPLDGPPVTLVGSANATTRGWGVFAARNVECMIELTPGIPIKSFLRDFVYEKKGEAKPWLAEFRSEHLRTETVEELLRDELARRVQALAGLEFALTYDGSTRTLAVRCDGAAGTLEEDREKGVIVEFAPLGILEDLAEDGRDSAWRPLAALADAALVYEDVAIAAVSAFVAIRIRAEGVNWVARIAQGDVSYVHADRDARDAAARLELLASASPTDILAKLVLGLGHVARRQSKPRSQFDVPGRSPASGSRTLGPIPLERVLQAIASNPRLIDELHLLLAGRSDPEFDRFLKDIRSVIST